MKGSAVVLLVCFAAFSTTPSLAYSVKFISEDEPAVNRQEAVTTKPSLKSSAPAVDEVQSANRDTSADRSENVQRGDDVKPEDKTIRDAQTEEPQALKRHARGVMGTMMARMTNSELIPVDKYDTILFLKTIGEQSSKCFKNAIRYLENYEMDDGGNTSPKGEFHMKGIMRWLKILRVFMSHCLSSMKVKDEANQQVPGKEGFAYGRLNAQNEVVSLSSLMTLFESIVRTLNESLEEYIGKLEGNVRPSIPPIVQHIVEEISSRVLNGEIGGPKPVQIFIPIQTMGSSELTIPVMPPSRKVTPAAHPRTTLREVPEVPVGDVPQAVTQVVPEEKPEFPGESAQTRISYPTSRPVYQFTLSTHGTQPKVRPVSQQHPSWGTHPSVRPVSQQHPSWGTHPSIRPVSRPSRAYGQFPPINPDRPTYTSRGSGQARKFSPFPPTYSNFAWPVQTAQGSGKARKFSPFPPTYGQYPPINPDHTFGGFENQHRATDQEEIADEDPLGETPGEELYDAVKENFPEIENTFSTSEMDQIVQEMGLGNYSQGPNGQTRKPVDDLEGKPDSSTCTSSCLDNNAGEEVSEMRSFD